MVVVDVHRGISEEAGVKTNFRKDGMLISAQLKAKAGIPHTELVLEEIDLALFYIHVYRPLEYYHNAVSSTGQITIQPLKELVRVKSLVFRQITLAFKRT